VRSFSRLCYLVRAIYEKSTQAHNFDYGGETDPRLAPTRPSAEWAGRGAFTVR